MIERRHRHHQLIDGDELKKWRTRKNQKKERMMKMKMMGLMIDEKKMKQKKILIEQKHSKAKSKQQLEQ